MHASDGQQTNSCGTQDFTSDMGRGARVFVVRSLPDILQHYSCWLCIGAETGSSLRWLKGIFSAPDIYPTLLHLRLTLTVGHWPSDRRWFFGTSDMVQLCHSAFVFDLVFRSW
jgi:hypothetical protein